jgi:hypothetical protein
LPAHLSGFDLSPQSEWLRELVGPTRQTTQPHTAVRIFFNPLHERRSLPDDNRAYIHQNRRLFVGGGIIAVLLLVGVAAWPLLTTNQLGTPKGGASPATARDNSGPRGAPAQTSAESTVGKNDPAGQEDTSGGRARAIKQSSQALQLNPQQREQLKGIIGQQADPPKIEGKPPFEMMIGAAVPRQVGSKDLPAEITQVLNGYWGDYYVLVQDKLVIVDQHSARVVAIVPGVA